VEADSQGAEDQTRPRAGAQLALRRGCRSETLEGAALCKWRSKRILERFTQILILARDTGMRNEKELYRMRVEDLYWEQRLIHVVDSKTVNGIRYVPMSDRVFTVLKTLCGTRTKGWVFPSKRSESGHLTTMAGKFRQAREKAGLPKKLVLYCGRHDFGTRILENTGNLKLVMSAMGHVDVKTAMKYQHPELGIVRTALNDSNHAVLSPSA
jgi:integrase